MAGDAPIDDPAAVLPPGMHDRLRRRYADPPRHHHTLEHAATVARHALDLGGDRACLLAAWFHDAIYDATAQDNEEASAILLRRWLPHDPDADEAARLVRATATHSVSPADQQAAILCDADLAVLGADPPTYEAYRRAVRREYAHVSDADWRIGRAAVLHRFLDRPRIYATDRAQDRWEAAARRNMTSELAALTADP